MNLSAPTFWVFLISAILAFLALASIFVFIPVVSINAFWFLLGGYLLLFLGNIVKGL